MVSSIQNTCTPSGCSLSRSHFIDQFEKQANLAQYKGSDYSNAVRVERHISLHEAAEIAAKDPNIDYFCYVKGHCMVLEANAEHAKNDPLGLISYTTYGKDSGGAETGYARLFTHGDVVFFSNKDGKKWLGEANGLCDTYCKKGN